MENRAFELKVERLGPLPVINHFLDRLGLLSIIERYLPRKDPRCRFAPVLGIGVLLRSILVEREPIYRLGEVVRTFAPEGFGLTAREAANLEDDVVGRALDRLFDADRGSVLTQVVLAAGERFGLCLDELHNDSTTVKFTGQYSAATGRSIRGKKAPFITRGYSKDHRPDLKQLLFILTSTREGGVPVQFRCEAGNQNDSRTHEETWDALCRVTGRKDFLYVADSKLCGEDTMEYIHRRGGRLVTVMPRSRLEDREFRKWIQDHEPPWEKVRDRVNPRRKGLPRDRWYVFKYHLPSKEGWPVIWVYSTLLELKHAQSRRERIAKAEQELDDLASHYLGPRPRRRARHEVLRQIDKILDRLHVRRYLNVSLTSVAEHFYRQDRPGRPGPDTTFTRRTKHRWKIERQLNEPNIDYDHKSDGMYPLLTNDRSLSLSGVLDAHKGQPTIEKRFEQTKTVFEIAPVFLKNESRIEALFFLYFATLLVQALIERELRNAMRAAGIKSLPLYPEERKNKRPTAEQIFRLFSLVERHTLCQDGRTVQVFEPELTELQTKVLGLLGVNGNAYSAKGN